MYEIFFANSSIIIRDFVKIAVNIGYRSIDADYYRYRYRSGDVGEYYRYRYRPRKININRPNTDV